MNKYNSVPYMFLCHSCELIITQAPFNRNLLHTWHNKNVLTYILGFILPL